METIQVKTSFISRFSVMIKLMVIGFLGLALLIPTAFIQEIIHERQRYSEEVMQEIHRQWANRQTLSGPIWSIPVSATDTELTTQKEGSKKYLHLTPKNLLIKGSIEPQTLKRGIYEAAVYTSQWELTGIIPQPDLAGSGRAFLEGLHPFLSFGISDLRGIEDPVMVQVAGKIYEVHPGSLVPELHESGFHVQLNQLDISQTKEIPFTISFRLRGSERVGVLPMGASTAVTLESTWKDPKFSGNFLPIEREIGEGGFEAIWQIAELNRNLPKSWISGDLQVAPFDAEFGVDFLSPMDHYRKAIRSAKYAILTIGLTFLMLFLVETVGNKPIHPIQYGMVGFAICLFYLLLVSISEHTAFNIAYFIAALSVILTVTAYSIPLFQSRLLTAVLGSILALSYGFVFLTLQSQDYALLIGSLGLLIALIVTMILTKNVNWYSVADKT
ncbi:MAG: cell envelope integrity protein CreD [Lunatimonas sp.]|uniref:cell envelope integrity protein CreD n=1 Tax=Lunatimonas sp. TaxID=2060141 RepID=UPI00263A9D42|nr:cell envelope integrity protein CreD [Lunatimonas sp.]MCC5939291.1 cell envelope integrity protein CreD [Lunatimonas sp.]